MRNDLGQIDILIRAPGSTDERTGRKKAGLRLQRARVRRSGRSNSGKKHKGNDYCNTNSTIADQIPPPDKRVVSLLLVERS